MTVRIDDARVAPDAARAMIGLERYLATSRVKLRAPLLNGCAYCIDMYTKDARAHGETEQRLYGLAAWRETPFYTQRERAALAWTDAVTLVSETHVPDDVFEAARAQFSEEELVDLTIVAVTINGWNRIAISFRSEVGSYQPRDGSKATVVGERFSKPLANPAVRQHKLSLRTQLEDRPAVARLTYALSAERPARAGSPDYNPSGVRRLSPIS
jgi:AhpD family alkylhydroperoxidase